MNQGPVSCIPNNKMSKAKKALDEAREIQARELDLVDKNVVSFDELPGLRKWNKLYSTTGFAKKKKSISIFGSKSKNMYVKCFFFGAIVVVFVFDICFDMKKFCQFFSFCLFYLFIF